MRCKKAMGITIPSLFYISGFFINSKNKQLVIKQLQWGRFSKLKERITKQKNLQNLDTNLNNC